MGVACERMCGVARGHVQVTVACASHLLFTSTLHIPVLPTYYSHLLLQLFTHGHLFEDSSGGDAESGEADEDEDEEEALFTLTGGCIWLTIVTVFIAFLSEQLTDTLEGASSAWGLGEVR